MSHDIEAAYAATEVVNRFITNPTECFDAPPSTGSLSGYAAREGRHAWPHADGVIELAIASGAKPTSYSVAVEYKRPNEGLHGVLTAIGQSQAYLRKGYAGSVIVIPEKYPGFITPGKYVSEVLDLTSNLPGIGVFTYSTPNMALVSPFAGKLSLCRPLKMDLHTLVTKKTTISRTETQWAHVREGSTDPDAIFKYLQAVKLLGGNILKSPPPVIPSKILAAIARVKPGVAPEKYLSNCPNDDLPDVAWRHFWFGFVLHAGSIDGWRIDTAGGFHVNETSSKIVRSDDNGNKLFFVGRSDSIKNKLVAELNSGAKTEDLAYDDLVENYHGRAHSYREDIDSGCEHLGFVDSFGRLTDSGYRFVDACERYGNPNEGIPRSLFLSALLGEGGLGAFLHYVYRLSEEIFSNNPLAFSSPNPNPKQAPLFNSQAYLSWLEEQMANRLRVMRKVSLRGGTKRKPFQAELAILRGMGIIRKKFRIGVGVVINWPEFNDHNNI